MILYYLLLQMEVQRHDEVTTRWKFLRVVVLGGGVSNIDLCYCASKPVCLSSYVSIFFYYFLTNRYYCVDVDLLILAASLSRDALVGCAGGVSGVSSFFFDVFKFFFFAKKILYANIKEI